MSLTVTKDDKDHFTYRDYCSWPENERWELIHGIPYNMSPAPSREHQEISIKLSSILYNFLKDKKCSVYAAPFDVRLPGSNENDEQIDTVVQPDISIICDKKKLDDKGCRGAPDFIIEITSPSTGAKDIKEKYFLYEKHKVKEYWIIHPQEKVVMVYLLRKTGKYGRHQAYTKDDQIKIKQFGGLEIDLELVFQEE